jgi:hypothetical protein
MLRGKWPWLFDGVRINAYFYSSGQDLVKYLTALWLFMEIPMIKYILAALLSVTLATPVLAQTPAPQPKKDTAKKDTAKKADDNKKAAAKPKNDPKWKENSLSKKQAECKADPSLAKCKKPAKDAKK